MMLNYHEMTMGQPRDSPERRKQFLIICTVIAAAFFHSLLMAGFFASLDIKEGIFPGGEFVYRYNVRDYAASAGLWEQIATDVNVSTAEYQDLIYSLFLDNPMDMGGGRQRYGTGILVDNKGMKEKGKVLLDSNPELEERSGKTQKKEDLTAAERFSLQQWLQTTLPSVDAAVVQFPHTGGFVSALATSYKVIPGILKYARDKGEKANVPVVITTCDKRQEMCTHYAPLVQGDQFLLGQPSSKEYLASLPPEKLVDWGQSWKNLKKFTPLGWIL